MKRIISYTVIALTLFVSWLAIDEPLDTDTARLLKAIPADPTADRLFAEFARHSSEAILTENPCAVWSTECLVAVNTRSAALLKVSEFPDEYWRSYYAILRYQPPMVQGEEISDAGHHLIQATRNVMLRDLAQHGAIQPATLERNLTQHRQLLATSSALIDKMIYTASLGILISAATFAASQPDATAAAVRQLVERTNLLRNLTAEERSLQRAIGGELRVAAGTLDSGMSPTLPAWAFKRNALLNRAKRVYMGWTAPLSLSDTAFWQNDPEPRPDRDLGYTLFDPVGDHFAALDEFNWVSYVNSLRLTDISLALARGAICLAGDACKESMHQLPPPPGWSWEIQGDDLCLFGDEIHPNHHDRELCRPFRYPPTPDSSQTPPLRSAASAPPA